MNKSNEEVNLKPEDVKKGLILFNQWFRKNWFTVVGIFLMLSITFYEMGTVEKQKADIVVRCNDYWYQKIQQYCPILYEKSIAPGLELKTNSTN